MSATKPSRLVAEVDFDKDGMQHGFVRLFHSVHASAYGFIPIPIVVIRNGAGPTALLLAGNHGDEYEGQVALGNLIRDLRPSDITGRIIILPMANFPAAMAGTRTSPIDDGNLNRLFPGDPDGSVTQQIAWFIMHTLAPMADLLCDLHSGGSSLIYTPCTLMKQTGDAALDARQLAMQRAFGAPHAYVTKGGHGAGIFSAAHRVGIPALGTEMAGGGAITPAALRIVERGLRSVLAHAGILPASAHVPAETPTRILQIGGPDYFVYASESGVWEPLVEIGSTVAAGQPAARIHTPETPWRPPVELAFARDGLVLCRRALGRTLRGDCLYNLGTDAPEDSRVQD